MRTWPQFTCSTQLSLSSCKASSLPSSTLALQSVNVLFLTTLLQVDEQALGQRAEATKAATAQQGAAQVSALQACGQEGQRVRDDVAAFSAATQQSMEEQHTAVEGAAAAAAKMVQSASEQLGGNVASQATAMCGQQDAMQEVVKQQHAADVQTGDNIHSTAGGAKQSLKGEARRPLCPAPPSLPHSLLCLVIA